jgi:DNA-binding transcriptional regulator YdaS (Cro superfamily)
MELKNWTNQERGRAADLARAIGVSQPIMARWVSGEEIPENRCRQIERATGGAVTCEEMRPDLVAEFAYMRTRPTVEASALPAVEETNPILKAA